MSEHLFEWIRWIGLALAGGQLLLSVLLLRIHFGSAGDLLDWACGGAFDCNSVLKSRYSKVSLLPPRPVPVAALGIAYAAMLVLWLLMVDRLPGALHQAWALPALVGLAGLAGSARFLYIMKFRLRSWCALCMTVHGINLLLVPGLWILWLSGGAAAASAAAWKVPLLTAGAGIATGLAIIRYAQVRDATRALDSTARKLDRVRTEQFLATSPVRIDVDSRNDPILGCPEMPHTAVIFSDFECSSCAEMHRVVHRLHEDLGRRLCIVHKDFPLSAACNPGRHEVRAPDSAHSCEAAAVAEAARRLGGSDAFWRMADLMFEHQHRLSRPAYEEFTRRLGLNLEAMACLQEEPEVLQQVREDAQAGTGLNVRATPTVFLDGRRLDNPVVQRGSVILVEETIEHWRDLLDTLERNARRPRRR